MQGSDVASSPFAFCLWMKNSPSCLCIQVMILCFGTPFFFAICISFSMCRLSAHVDGLLVVSVAHFGMARYGLSLIHI